MRVRDLMAVDPISVGPTASLKDAARRMVMAKVSGLPVTDEDGDLVGIITEADFVSSEAKRDTHDRAGLLRFFTRDNGVPSGTRTVGDVMTKKLVVVAPDADHVQAARLMEKNHVKRLPVVEGRNLVGLISRADILRSFIRPDSAIIHEISQDIIKRILWIDPKLVKVQCIDGNVVLSGHLDTKTDVDLLTAMVGRVDGVASLDAHLTYESDSVHVEMAGATTVPFPRVHR